MPNKDSGQKSCVFCKRWSRKDMCDLKRDPKEVKKQTRWCVSVEEGGKHSKQRDQKVQRPQDMLGMFNW